MPPHVAVTLQSGDEQLAGWILDYDTKGFHITTERADGGPRRFIRWSALSPGHVLELHTLLLAPDDAAAWLRLGDRLLRMNEGAESAKQAFRRVVAIDSSRVDDVRRLVRIWNAEQEEARQNAALTEEICKLDEPIPVTLHLRRGVEEISGDLLRFNDTHLWVAAGETEPRQIAWSDLRIEAITTLLPDILDTNNAMGWFRAGRLLLSLPDGEDAAKTAFTHAVALSPNLQELVLTAYRAPASRPGADVEQALQNDKPVEFLTDFDCALRHPVTSWGVSNYRLGGFLSEAFGALHQPYELNSQARARHLNLYELKLIGPIVALAAADFCTSSAARRLLAENDEQRLRRAALWERYGDLPRIAQAGPFFAEDYIQVLPDVEHQWRKMGRVPGFLKPLYDTQGPRIPRVLLNEEMKQ